MTTDTDAPPRPSLPEQLERAAIQAAILDALKKATDGHRDMVFADMMAAKQALDVKSFDVKLDGDVVATATIKEPSDRRIIQTVDTEAYEAYLDFMQEHYPSEVETIVQVRPNFEKQFLESLTAVGEELFDPNTGLTVPGTKNIPAGDATSWTLTFKRATKDKASGKERVLAAALPPEAQALLGLGEPEAIGASS
jgi:hypothetical protein